MEAKVDKIKFVSFRINAKISFVLESKIYSSLGNLAF